MSPVALTNGKPELHAPPAGLHGFSTRAVHTGSEPHLSASGGVSTALDFSSTFAQASVGELKQGFEYSRSANPTRVALERLVASLEGADWRLEEALQGRGELGWTGGAAAVAVASGSAATATVVSGLAGQGGHIISVADVYGGTSRYMLRVAGELQGTTTTFLDLSYSGDDLAADDIDENATLARESAEDEVILARLRDAVRAETKLIWIETPTNPLLSLVPIKLVASFGKQHGIPVVVDNTFASPFYQQPLDLGASVVIHSATKYLGGHSDLLAGLVVTADPDLLLKFRFLQNAHGGIISPFDSYQLIRSIKTLALRAKQHGLNALKVATYLDARKHLVRDVAYPGLRRAQETVRQRRERHLAWAHLSPAARTWAEKLGFSRDGPEGFPSSGIVSFHLNSAAQASQTDATAAETFLRELGVFTLAESLGGVESLAELPLKMTHAGVAVERRRELGIDGELVRLSVGVEEEEDLLEDVRQALEKAVGVGAGAGAK